MHLAAVETPGGRGGVGCPRKHRSCFVGRLSYLHMRTHLHNGLMLALSKQQTSSSPHPCPRKTLVYLISHLSPTPSTPHPSSPRSARAGLLSAVVPAQGAELESRRHKGEGLGHAGDSELSKEEAVNTPRAAECLLSGDKK